MPPKHGIKPEIADGSAWTEENLDPERIQTLTRELIAQQESAPQRYQIVAIEEPGDTYADIARFVEWTVFDEYFSNDIDVMREEYEQYDNSSVFLLTLDTETEQPAGVIRIITPTDAGLKSVHDVIDEDGPWSGAKTQQELVEELGGDIADVADIATMAVMPDYRSAHDRIGVSASLYSSCVQWSLARGYDRWITVVDSRIYDMMQSWGEPFSNFTELDWQPYLDSSSSLPVHTQLSTGLERIKAFNEDIHALYTRGAGLEEQFVFPDLN